MKKMLVPILALAIGVVVILVGCRATRGGYESAPYSVVRSDGKFELRDYPALTVVETPMAQAGNGADGSFIRLFRFITGRNEAKQKIAMTTPVFMSGSGSNTTMAFVMPAKLKTAEVPRPADDALKVRELELGRFAVLRFSGGRSSDNESKALGRLKSVSSDTLTLDRAGLSMEDAPDSNQDGHRHLFATVVGPGDELNVHWSTRRRE